MQLKEVQEQHTAGLTDEINGAALANPYEGARFCLLKS